MNPKLVCVISGPTASGKTKTSLELCRLFPEAEVVNFDSLLFYKELNIGTAKPDAEETAACPHHLIDIRSAKDPLNAADFQDLALQEIARLHERGKIPVLTGGSGFYLQALIYGMFDSSGADQDTRERSDHLYKEEGIAPFLEILAQKDPESRARYHENDHYRIRRAVEHLWTTGSKFSDQRHAMMERRERDSNAVRLGWELFHAYLDIPKDLHFQIICERTKQMLANGLIEEVEGLLLNGFTGKEKPLGSIGYKETIQYLEGKLDRAQLEERINISTRQLAKAQRTWFKKVEKNMYNPLEDLDRLLEDIKNFVNEKRGHL